MAFKFSKLLPPDQRANFEARMKWQKAEIERFYNMPDRFKARTLLGYARAVRDELPLEIGIGGRYWDGYSGRLVWEVMPALAKALGETRLDADEENLLPNFPTRPDKIRTYVSNFMANHGFTSYDPLRCSDAPDSVVSLISQLPIHGNPISIALDALYPPTLESTDDIAKDFRSACRARFGDERYLSWEPDFENFKLIRERERLEKQAVEIPIASLGM